MVKLQRGDRSRFPRLHLCSIRWCWRLLVPQSALVLWPSTQIPGLDQEALCCIDVAFSSDLLNPNLQPIFGENNVFRLHLI
jgi:hypothetical protein